MLTKEFFGSTIPLNKKKRREQYGKSGRHFDGRRKRNAVAYTVKLTGLNKKVMSKDKTFNALYVDTTIPGKMKNKVKVTNVKLIIDGKTVKTYKKGVLTPDPGKSDAFTQIQVINTWNSRVGKVSYKMPKKSVGLERQLHLVGQLEQPHVV